LNGSGQAVCNATLGEGDHSITATYGGVPGTFSLSTATYTQRMDNASTVSANGNTYTFCNTGAITIPDPNTASHKFQALPNPSNVFVTNLPGTVNTTALTLKAVTGYGGSSEFTYMALSGPSSKALDIFSSIGNDTHVFATADISIADANSSLAPNTSTAVPTSGPYNYKPTDNSAGDTFINSTSGFFNAPASFGTAAPIGSTTFASEFGNINGNGTWGIFINQNFINTGPSIAGGWCNAITVNPPDVQLTGTNTSQFTNGTFTQNQSSSYVVTVHNNGPGLTGNTPTTAAPQVVIALDANLSYNGTPTGTNWSCGSAVGQSITCTFSATVASGADFPALTVPVNVSINAPTSVTSTATYSGGGDGTGSNNVATNTATVIQIPKLSVAKSHTGNFVNGQPAQWTVAVSNVGGGAAASGTVVVTDTLPAGFTFSSFTGSNWNCVLQSGTTYQCTTTGSIAAGTIGTPTVSSFTFNGNVSTAGTSLSNTANLSVTGGSPAFISVSTSTDVATVVQPAVVTGVSSTNANGTYGVGATLSITVTFNMPVTVTGTPTLALNSGGTASYSVGSGTSTLTFSYTVASGQNANPLDENSTTALALSGGTIIGNNSVAANLTLPAPAATGSLGKNKTIVIDTVAPTVVSYSVLFGTQSYNLVGSARVRLPWQISGIQVVFSKPIGTADMSSLTGITDTGLTGLGTTTLTWSLTPVGIGAFTTALAGTGTHAIKDAVGNPLTGGTGYSQNFKLLWGDANDDGVVTAVDLAMVNAARSQPYNVFCDANGDGVVDATDVNTVRAHLGTSQN
jgi:uncharacterized repeat protein (TIGR01451 family)